MEAINDAPVADTVTPTEPQDQQGKRPYELITYICFFLLGVGGWLVLNSLFLEAPLLIRHLPEGDDLSTYLLIAQQVASVMVLIPTELWGALASERHLNIIILSTLSVSIVSAIIVIIWGLDHVGGFSFPFLFMALVTSACGYISSTFFLPYTSLYRAVHTNGYTIGLGVSLALTALLSLIQDSGSTNPRFSYEVYFIIIIVINILSLLAAAWLIFSDGAKTERAKLTYSCHHSNDFNADQRVEDLKISTQEFIPSSYRVLLMWSKPVIIQFVLAFLGFGIVPSLLPYASLSYRHGNSIYMYAIFLLYFVDPFGRTLYGTNKWAWMADSTHLLITSSFAGFFGLWVCILAGLSPDPFLYEYEYGGLLCIAMTALCGWFYSTSFTGSYANMFQVVSLLSPEEQASLRRDTKSTPATITVLEDDSKVAVEMTPPKLSELPSNTSDSTTSGSNSEHCAADLEKDTTPCAHGSGGNAQIEGETDDTGAIIDIPSQPGPDLGSDFACSHCRQMRYEHDQLRAALYRLGGIGLQVGSFIGTFLGAFLTIFFQVIEPSIER